MITAGKIFDRLLSVLVVLSSILLAAIWLLLCAEVVSRYFWSKPMGWPSEIAIYNLVWICFLGSAWLLRKDGHVSVNVLISKLSTENAARINGLISIICTILCLVVAWYSGMVTLELFQANVKFPTILELPKGPIEMIVPIGSLLLSVQFARRSYGFFVNFNTKRHYHKV